MGWSASYQLLRETPLSAEEIAALAQLNQDEAAAPWEGETFWIAVTPDARPDHVLAAGSTKFPNGDSEDPDRLGEVLERLAELVPGAELRVVDDYGFFERPGKRSPPWISVPHDDLIDPAKLAPPSLPPLPGAALLAAELAGDAPEVSEHAEIEALYRALATLDGVSPEVAEAKAQRAAIEALLGRAAAATVALVGLELYPQLFTYYAARDVLDRALERVTSPGKLVAPFLAAWTQGEGVYYYKDMPLPERFRDALAADEKVRQQMIEDLRRSERAPDDELAQRRGQAAVDFLVRGGHSQAIAAVIDLIMRWRDQPRTFRFDYGVWMAAHEQLAKRGDGRSFATLALYLSAMKSPTRSHDAALAGLVRIDARRAAPMVTGLAAADALLPVVVGLLPQLGELGGDAAERAVAELRRLAAFPSKDLRQRACDGLTQLGLDPGEPAALPPPEELLLHPVDELRDRALGEVHRRKDPSLYLSLAAAAAVDAHLRARTDRASLPFSWYGWDERLPEQVLRLRAEPTLTWAVENAEKVFGPQTILPAIAQVLAEGARAVAESIPATAWKLSDEDVERLRLDEHQAHRALQGGSLGDLF